MKKPVIIGWKESIDLPEWGIRHLTAKADTGARRSAIDVDNIVDLGDGRVRFDLVLDRRNLSLTRSVTAPIAHQTHVRSSNGIGHDRYFVETDVVIAGRAKRIELSLVGRRRMSCRMLLGRAALERDFLVDSSVRHVSRPNKRLKLET